ncbi:MAG: hypothetical protein H6Q74_2824 [Firmicutes bacterium]|nr:hypothetical protein [Bacillota bacterium]
MSCNWRLEEWNYPEIQGEEDYPIASRFIIPDIGDPLSGINSFEYYHHYHWHANCHPSYYECHPSRW